MRLESTQNLLKLVAMSFSKGMKLAPFGASADQSRGLTIKEWGLFYMAYRLVGTRLTPAR
jgi:hypothetical protein